MQKETKSSLTSLTGGNTTSTSHTGFSSRIN